MSDRPCVALLQWALPLLGKRWEGFRNVRGQVCKRLARRAAELGLGDLDAYRAYLASHPEELDVVDALSRVTISRFYRDRAVMDRLTGELLPELASLALARGERTLRVWSAGCASGEEPYTLAIAWKLALAARFPALTLSIVATDLDDEVLARARRGLYEESSLRELPQALRERAFEREGPLARVRDEVRELVTFARQDLRTERPAGTFHLVLCRNLLFTYFDEALQRELGERIAGVMPPGGLLLLGGHEHLPAAGIPGFAPVDGRIPAYRRT